MFERMYPTTWTKLDFLCSCSALLLLAVHVSVCVTAGWLAAAAAAHFCFFFFLFHFHRHSFMNYVPVYIHKSDVLVCMTHACVCEFECERDFNLVNVNVPILACCY